MKTQVLRSYLRVLQDIYPSERVCNNISYCSKKRGYGRKYDSAELNMQMIYDTDIARAWLYVDLASNKTFTQMRAWWENYLTVDFKNWQASCDAAYEFFRRNNIPAMRISEFKAQFKKETGMAPTFLLAPFWSQVEQYLLSNEKVAVTWFDLMRKIVQWTRFSRKLRLINTTAEEAAYTKFKLNDVRLEQHWAEPDSERDRILERIQSIVTSWLEPYPFRIDFPHHGSGATADPETKRNITQKCIACSRTDQELEWLFRKLQLSTPLQDLNIQIPMTRDLKRSARWLTVDKNIDERRGIGPQEAALMWVQQGVREWFYCGPFRSPFFRKHMPIFDREVNRSWAVRGSKLNHVSTVDLSSASDSNSVHLIKGIFKGDLRYALMLARSKSFDVEPERSFTTYATMGDATTFPVETIIFGACVQLAITIAVTRYRDAWVKLPFDPDTWSVFGDDIVCPNDPQVMKNLYWILTKLGFKVNYDKSFVHGPYRESCGIEAYLGEDITPLYFRVKVSDPGARFASLIALANLSYESSLKTLRQWAILVLKDEFHNIPFTERRDDNSRVYTPNLRLDNTSTIWLKDIQQLAIKSRGLRSPREDITSSDYNENYAYYMRLHSVYSEDAYSDKNIRRGYTTVSEISFRRKHGLEGYIFDILHEEEASEPCYDERLCKLTQVAVPVRLLVRAT